MSKKWFLIRGVPIIMSIKSNTSDEIVTADSEVVTADDETITVDQDEE